MSTLVTRTVHRRKRYYQNQTFFLLGIIPLLNYKICCFMNKIKLKQQILYMKDPRFLFQRWLPSLRVSWSWLPPTHTNQGANINHNIFNQSPDVPDSCRMTLLLQTTFISIIPMTVATMWMSEWDEKYQTSSSVCEHAPYSQYSTSELKKVKLIFPSWQK